MTDSDKQYRRLYGTAKECHRNILFDSQILSNSGGLKNIERYRYVNQIYIVMQMPHHHGIWG